MWGEKESLNLGPTVLLRDDMKQNTGNQDD